MHNLKNKIFGLCFVFAGFLFSIASAHALEIRNIRFGEHGTSIRCVMDLDAEADFRAMVQDNPPRIVIDTPMLSGKPAIRRSILPDSVDDVRLEPLAGGYSRITLVLLQKAVIRSAFVMPPAGNQSARLVVDMAPATDERFTQYIGKPVGTLTIKQGGATASDKLPFAGIGGAKLELIGPKTGTATGIQAPEKPETLPLIMIDAGHGGRDSGAARHGVQEKDITLAVARALKTALMAEGRYRVELTRDKDVFIRLDERVAIARRAKADLFISLHADSAPDTVSSARGASVFTISERASDAMAARLAESENKADLLDGVELPSNAADVADILVDLTMRETTSQSRYFAGQLVKTFGHNNIPLLPAPHKQAGFMVLKAPDIPSVLIELGFVSNPVEAKRLNEETYRAALAKSIATGIDTWFKTKKH